MKQYLLILLVFMSCFSAFSRAETQLNHDQLVKEFIETLNSKNLQQIEKFVVEHFSSAALARWGGEGKNRYLGYSMNQALFHGKLRLISSELNSSNEQIRYASKVQSTNADMQYDMVVNFNNEQSRAITGWYIREAPKALKSASITEAEMVSELERYTEQLAKNGVFSGTLLLAREDDILLSAAHGLASRRYDAKNNIDTKFQIGSMNKMFTSVAVLQLIQAGKIALNDPLTRFIDKSQLGKGDFEQIKIKHLLTHTSGIGGMSGFEEIQSKIRQLSDIQPLYSSIETSFEPGSQWRYSNTGMMLLGQVIETVTGENYYDYIDRNIYQKASMNHSGSFDLDVPVKNSARSYWFSVETGQITENLMFQSVKGLPAGGGYSTVGDLHKFALAMENNILLSPELSRFALSAKPELNAPNWGYGFSVRETDIGMIVGHNGDHRD